MKVCYLNHDIRNDTGAGSFCLSLMKAMRIADSNYAYRVLTHDDFLPEKFINSLFKYFPIRRSLAECDIIHALDGWPYGVIAALVALGSKKKVIITAIGTGAVQPLYSLWKKPLLRWAYRKADIITAVSSNTRKEILKVIPDLKIEVINHGVDFEKFQKPSRRYEEIRNLKPYILSVGAWKSRKGFEYSLAAFKEARREFPSLKYVIVSGGPENKNIEGVNFFHRTPEDFLVALYQNAELFILLPQDVGKDIEGFGLAFLEAAASGLPIIATKNTSAEDSVIDGEAGFLIPQGNFRDAAEALEKILKDKSLKSKFSRAAVEFAKKMSWQKAAEDYKSLYQNLYA